MDNSSTWKIIDKYFEDNPQCLVRHHIESYNDFFKNGIFQIFKEKNPIKIQTRYDENIDDYRSQCIMYFGGKDGTKLYFGKPIIYDENDAHYMYPNEARLRNMTYGMTIHYDVEIEFIDILETGEMPSIVDEEGELTYGGSAELPEFNNFKENLEKEGDREKKEGGDPEDPKDTEPIAELSGGAPARKQKKRVATELTAAQTALLREATEKSMVTPNIQKRTTVLEKVYLGKFPIMVQSDFCVLSGLSREVRHTMGECLNDIGGYFIIDGKEKTVITQEKFGDNMLYIKESNDDNYLYSAEIRSVSENVAKPIRTLSVKIMAPNSRYTFKNIVVNIPNVRKPVPLFIVFRALGIISDKQIITTCLLDLDKYEQMVDLFAPSVHDAGSILTQRNALKYIATLTKGKTVSHTLEILADYFFPHIGEMNFIQKAYYLGYVVFRLLNVYTGVEQPTDRDNYKFKRLELVGSLTNDLFREYYTIQQRLIHLGFEEKITYNRATYENNLPGLIKENFKTVFAERTVEAGFKKAFKGNWGSQEHTKRIGIVQDLNRLSHNSMMSHLRKTNLPLDASVKLVGPRSLHSTQWGFFDPIDTPDGGNIGIHKHMSISAYVTQGYSREPMINWLREKEEMKLIEDCSPLELSRLTKVIINGLWAGAISDPVKTVEKIRLFRRNALIPIYTSATFDIKQNTVFIYTDAGRICRPIFYRDQDTGKMSYDNSLVKTLVSEGDFTWNQLTTGFNPKKVSGFHPNNYQMFELSELYEGITEESNPAKIQKFLEYKAIIDYIDTNETENALIALNAEAMDSEEHSKFTHMEIHESFIFGMMCNLINFPENNPATRNSFSCGQSKQACSMYHTNHQVRMDKTAVVLVSGQTPLVKTRYLEHINHQENPYGENAIVAIMCYTGYNVEDAVLINEGALKRGLFRTTYYTTYETHEEKSKTGEVTVNKVFTNIENEDNVVGLKSGYDYSKLDKYGLIRENTPVDEKTVLIGLTASSSASQDKKTDMSKTPKKGQLGIVDKSFITEGEEGNRIAKIRIREERIPNIGDKMASRAGQKGTVGLVVPECDMPFTKDGIRPDIIINPHAIPSRMTIGHLVECIVGKAATIYGGFADSTAFNNKGSKIKVFGEILSQVGYHSSGNEILYNGMTGEQIETEIFFGPNYYMRLKHMVKDKINYRALGPRTALTKQPVGGRANDGGLRIGEMERDAVISHGAADFLRESMMERGDKYQLAVCNTTGLIAIFNPAKNIFMSPMADGPLRFFTSMDGKETHIENITKFGRNFSIVNVPYSLKLLIQELQTINIQMRIITEDNIKQLENMSYSKNIGKLLFKNDITPQEIIYSIKKDLDSTRRKPDVYATPESIRVKTPSPDYPNVSPAYVDPNSPSPRSDRSSPPYNPFSPEQEPYSPPYNPNTPPYSPPYNPNEEGNYSPHTPEEPPPLEQVRQEYSPHSPEEPPPNMEGGESGGPIRFKRDILSDEASKYTQGERVHYRGDSMPTRLWKISDVGDRLLTIEAETTMGLDAMDTTKIVTAADIYRQGEYSNSLPFQEPLQPMAGLYNSFDEANYATMPMRQPITHGMPAINFAPVIKVLNGGSDFSTDPTNGGEAPQLSDAAAGISSMISPAAVPTITSSSGGESSNILPDGPLIVKKV
jgi:DNA-directed RNA polymerase II subunit RPB2